MAFGTATIDNSCLLTVAGTATFDAQHGAHFASASGTASRASGAVTATQSGISVTLDDFSTPDASAQWNSNVSWTVNDSSGGTRTANETIKVGLQSLVTTSSARTPTNALSDDGMVGRQALFDPSCPVCTGLRGSIAGAAGTFCFLSASGQPYCFGDNGLYGYLGGGSASYTSEECRPTRSVRAWHHWLSERERSRISW